MHFEDSARRFIGFSLGYCEASEPFDLHDVVLSDPALVLWLDDGPEIRVTRGAASWTIRPKEGLFDYYPAGVFDLIRRGPGSARGLKISIPAELAAAGGPPNGNDRGPRFQFKDRRLGNLVRHLHAVQSHADAMYVEFLTNATLDCWIEHQAAAHDRRHAADLSEPTRHLIAAYVDRSLSKNIGVDELARLTGYSEAQFLRRFRANFNAPLHSYVLERRVERAKDLISKTTLTLTEVSQQLGFASHAHFSTAFKRRTGGTPSEYRRSPLAVPSARAT